MSSKSTSEASGLVSNSEWRERLQHSRDMMNVFLDAYAKFPTAKNFDLLAERMREHQEIWMHHAGTRAGAAP